MEKFERKDITRYDSARLGLLVLVLRIGMVDNWTLLGDKRKIRKFGEMSLAQRLLKS